jgi:hypothetical protein
MSKFLFLISEFLFVRKLNSKSKTNQNKDNKPKIIRMRLEDRKRALYKQYSSPVFEQDYS